jgi:nitrite reductase/ring-hydroxylating ferredoxin subunit
MTALAPNLPSHPVRRWQPVALSSQIPAGKPVRVTIGELDLVIFRDDAGICRTLADRCAHRRAPLSLGKITEEFLVECPYHGWRYDGASGACTAIPNLRPDEKIPAHFRVAAFETLERDGWVQVLLGAGSVLTKQESLELPGLGDTPHEGERALAYPADLFPSTLVDSPSAILSIAGIRILDDHPLGDPVTDADQVTIEYAAMKARPPSRAPKHEPGDFAYTVRLIAAASVVRIFVSSSEDAQLRAAAVIVGVPMGQRITRALWRGSALSGPGTPLKISISDYIDAHPVRASNRFVSSSWSDSLARFA